VRLASLAGVEGFLALRQIFEEYLEGLRFTKEPALKRLQEAMRYSLLAGGKRVRPLLCMESARLFGAPPERVLPSAAAIELIHTFSLIHDDLPAMDNDDFRRGRPTNHKKFGEAMAILAGDAFFGESLALITDHQKGSAEQVLAVVRELAHATGLAGLAGGQALDLEHTGRRAGPKELELTHRYKTGALIRASARIGAILAGADDEGLEAISQYATELGLCFQIVDDVLDAVGSSERLGKRAGGDAERGKATFVSVFGLEGARREADAACERALRALCGLDRDTSRLEALALFVRDRNR
jgi:geranylgeranyl diphosphate synthase type II